MGEVYRARDTKLNRDVALKVLPDAFALDPERLLRFRREAQVLASLNHTNIAAIHGFEESDGVQALVLEYVDGPTLADRIAQGPMPLDEALPIARQIADALEAAHEQGVIHRDLKPTNIKVRPDGVVKVLDFGLAKLTAPSDPGGPNASQSPTITTPAMTRMGMILGTAAYMSPEQAKGRPVDKRCDVWAFGCVLYEMLTGRRAFEGDGVSDTLAAVLRGEPDWHALPPEVPSALRSLVQRCLDKDPKRRVGDLSVARFVLEEPMSLAPALVSATPPTLRPRWKSVATIITAVFFTAVLVGTATWRLRPSVPPPPVARFSFTIPEGQRLTSTSNHFVAISPDGSQLAYVASDRVFLRSVADFASRVLAGTEDQGISSPAFSEDGSALVFYSARDKAVKRIAITGGVPTSICSADQEPYGMTWHSSGIVFGQGRNGILRCSLNGGNPERLAAVQEGEEAHGPQLLLDGAALLFSVAKVADRTTRWDTAQVVVHTMTSGTRKTIVNGGTDARYLLTGHLVYATRGVVVAVPFDAVRQMIIGDPVPVIEGVRRPAFLVLNSGAAQFATSPTGTLFYVPGPTGTTTAELSLAVADRAGALTRLAAPPGPYERVRASPDSKRLAISTDDATEANVWIYEITGQTAMRRLTFGGQNRFPIWSPDGRRIAFQSDREGDLALFAQNADGTGAVERLTKAQQGEAHAPESWSPDGRHILFSVRKGPRFSLYLLSLDGKNAEPYGGVESTQPIGAVFSPDGRWVAYAFASDPGDISRNRGVYVQPFPATGARYQVPKEQATDIDYHPVWAPSGTELFYTPNAGSGQLSGVSVSTRPTLAFGNPFSFPAGVAAARVSTQTRAYDILPDGRFVGLIPASQPESSDASRSSVEMRVVLNWFEELKARVPIN
jgi:serine/threonine-protein kinase